MVSSFWFLLDVLGTATRSTKAFGVPAFENRYNDFRQVLQPSSVYGYVSDNPPNDPSDMAEFHLTQYTLAPAIIKKSPKANLVIVNYHSKQLDTKLLQANHLALLKDFGNGVALSRRTQR